MEERYPTENEIWYIVNSYFKKYGLVRHQIESYDNFLIFNLPQIIQESNEIKVVQGDETDIISLCNVSFQKRYYLIWHDVEVLHTIALLL